MNKIELLFENLAILIPLIPIFAAFITLFFGNKIDRPHHGFLVAFIALGSSFALTLLVSGEVILRLLFLDASVEDTTVRYVTEWFHVGGFSLDIGILLDPLTAVVSLMVALISFLVVVYSRSYMAHDGSPRYYAEINLFVAAMLGLCFSPNFIQLFLFWEMMGVCSYLLIGYYYDKEVVPEGQPHPASAAKKAFLTTKVGDVFLFVGIILIYLEAHTFDFLEIHQLLEDGVINIDPNLIMLIALFIFAGAIGKSAQFPLHVWLPDAMAGPTTVSCLIHAATMVKAGIFLVARTYFIFEQADIVNNGNTLLVIGLIGGITAILAASIALVQTDIKGILAYSTISQIAYMTVSLGIGGMAGSIFHLLNHGIFKALLFLSAGSVIHGANSQDIREMGGLKEKMPHTWKVMLIGALSLAGIGNGFFSKDAIIALNLSKVLDPHLTPLHEQLMLLIWLSIVITAFLTAFYIFRLWFFVFPGTNRLPEHEIHESDHWMTIPLWILAILSLLMTGYYTIGLFFSDFSFEHFLHQWLEPGIPILEFNWLVGISSIVLAVAGIGFAYLIYYPRGSAKVTFPDEKSIKFEVYKTDSIITTQNLTRSMVNKFKLSFFGGMILHLLEKGYYIDDLYLSFVYFVDTKYCAMMNWIECHVFDATVRFIGKLGYWLCGVSKWMDEKVIDQGVIRNCARGVMKCAEYLRHIQTGVIEDYAFYGLVGAIVLLVSALALSG
ncbi:MAG: NADH-quinone oxidoreductase subunit L [Candidatus Thorarchaeota archaeon]